MKKQILTSALALIISSTIAFAQSENKKLFSEKKQQKDSVYYICPAHSDAKVAGEGKCPKCNADLEQKTTKECDVKPEKKETPKICICPMHPGMKSDKQGKCPDCGGYLVEKKKK